MQIEDVELKQIQAGNQEVRKKLEGFRSGLQKLMSKKSKKTQKYQTPSRDTKSPQNKIDSRYFSVNSAYSGSLINAFKSSTIGKEIDFGFNSTLFRQIGDETLLSNSSEVNEIENGSKFEHSVSHKDYFSATGPQSRDSYKQEAQRSDSQSFKKSSKLFSQIDQLMNKVNKSSKLPVKPIQKYFDKLETKINSSNFAELDLSLSNTVTQIEQNHSPYSNIDNNKKTHNRTKQNKDGNKKINQLAKLQVKSAINLLTDIKQKNNSIKTPPLPPQLSQRDYESKPNQKQKAQRHYKQLTVKNHIQQTIFEETKVEGNKYNQPFKGVMIQNSVQIHRIKIKQTLNERKKIVKEEGILDESIELELSSEQQNDNKKQINNRSTHTQQKLYQIRMLETEREKLLKQLHQIEQQLQRLEND